MQSNVENSVSDSSVRIDPNVMRPAKPTTETETDSEQDAIITNNHHYNRPVQQYPAAVCNAFQVSRFRRKLCIYTQQMRMQPYYVPHRTRTKSENSDLPLSAGGTDTAPDVGPPSLPNSTLMETGEPPTMDIPMNSAGVASAALLSVARSRFPVVMLKKYRSLEDVRVDNSLEGSQPSHEMEFVSSRIQQLKVQE
ncbi:uncharacterized protein LOC131216627 [Anopheles bellator]|uniref:uncharacterized protein LOC131216627 n=1 Tax=Anopheles bellator TaxID=139047 RepID=UPI0026478A2E|nr:uncharacterized protein LOC131216627 [Anopheles bellator]